MNKILSGVILVMFVLMLSACEQRAAVSSPPPSESTATVNPTPTVTQDTVPIRSKLENISFGQNDEGGGYLFLDWQAADIPKEPTDVIYHLDEVIFSATYKGLSEQEQQHSISQIQVKGNVKWEVKPNPDYATGILITFQKPAESFELLFGDLPTITFKRMEPLNYTVSSASGKEIPYLLLNAREYGTRLLIPNEEKDIVLTFSEKMQKNLPTRYDDSDLATEWRDDKQLIINLNNIDPQELILTLDKLKSQSGNYLTFFQNNLHIQMVPNYKWYNAQSGDPLEMQPRDRYYDQMIWSPDGKSYIGIVTLGGSMGDGDGTSYSFLLERPGQQPVIIEDVFYSTIEPNGQPIAWMNSNTLIYSSYFGVFAYDIDKKQKKVLHHFDEGKSNGINFAVYDAKRQLLHVLAYEGPIDEYDLFTYEQGKDAPQQTKNFTATVQITKYSNLDMNIIPTAEGTYWTRIKDGIPYTEFINNKGDVISVNGYVRLISEQGVYLERFAKAVEGESFMRSLGWVIWQPGKSERTISLLPEHNNLIVSGQELFSLKDSIYYKYDPVLNKWIEWKAPNGKMNAEPIRGTIGLYRVH